MARETLNPQQADFVAGVVRGLSNTQAAIHAGYEPANAASQGTRLAKQAKVKEAIAAGRLRIAQRQSMEADDVLTEWVKIATADPNELVSLERGACRHCHGVGHEYHWRNPAEFDKAMQDYLLLPAKRQMVVIRPEDAGGFGYRFRADPHPDCPSCEGEGHTRTVLRDTRNLSPGARALYAGVRETQHGIEVKMRDQDGALEKIARHLGMFSEDNKREHGVSDPIKEMLEGIWKQGSKAPIAPQGGDA